MLMKTNRVLKTEDLVYRCGVEMKLFKYLEGGGKKQIYTLAARCYFARATDTLLKGRTRGVFRAFNFADHFKREAMRNQCHLDGANQFLRDKVPSTDCSKTLQLDQSGARDVISWNGTERRTEKEKKKKKESSGAKVSSFHADTSGLYRFRRLY